MCVISVGFSGSAASLMRRSGLVDEDIGDGDIVTTTTDEDTTVLMPPERAAPAAPAAAAGGGSAAVWSLAFYQAYFDVDTAQVCAWRRSSLSLSRKTICS